MQLKLRHTSRFQHLACRDRANCGSLFRHFCSKLIRLMDRHESKIFGTQPKLSSSSFSPIAGCLIINFSFFFSFFVSPKTKSVQAGWPRRLGSTPGDPQTIPTRVHPHARAILCSLLMLATTQLPNVSVHACLFGVHACWNMRKSMRASIACMLPP